VAKKEADPVPSPSSTLERIGQYSRDMISEMNDIVWVINPRNDSFEKIIDRIQDYALVLCGSRNIQFSMESNPQISDLPLSMRQRKNLFLVLKEAINNAVKHSGCTELTVRFSRSGALLWADIMDNGKGIPSKSHSGNGLTNMQQRAEELGGRLDIQSFEGKGSVVSITMPITHNAY
jgi:signal transduction histidine kinase